VEAGPRQLEHRQGCVDGDVDPAAASWARFLSEAVLIIGSVYVAIVLEGLSQERSDARDATLYDVTPVSFAQCGLLPQFHRDPEDIYDNIEALLAAEGRPVPPRANVPNAYLGGKVVPDE